MAVGCVSTLFFLVSYIKITDSYREAPLLTALLLFFSLSEGNFSYFWIKKDYSLFRLLRMMFRLNFLVIMVMAVTNHEFVRYYVCAMHTYWFITVYAMMAVFKRYNDVRIANKI